MDDSREEALEEFCKELKRQKTGNPENLVVTHQEILIG